MKKRIKFINELKKYIKLTTFLPDQCGIPLTARVRHKISGKDGSGKPLSFSDQEFEIICLQINIWAQKKFSESLRN